MRNPGVGQDLTGLAAAVQLRLRVAIGLQALQRCSGLLNRRARGSTVATHHFRIRGETIIILRFEREFAGGSPAGCTNSRRVSPITRDAPLRTERLGVEIPHAAPIC